MFSGLAPRNRTGNSRIFLSFSFLKYLPTSDFIFVIKYLNLKNVSRVINSNIESFNVSNYSIELSKTSQNKVLLENFSEKFKKKEKLNKYRRGIAKTI